MLVGVWSAEVKQGSVFAGQLFPSRSLIKLTGYSGDGGPKARPICAVSVVSGSFTEKILDRTGSSSTVSATGSGLIVEVSCHITDRTTYHREIE